MKKSPRPNRVFDCARVVVVDGDTIHAALDLGFGVQVLETFRLDGIDAPEMNTAAGKASKAWLLAAATTAKRLTIVSRKLASDKQLTDKYGRYVVTVWADGVDLCALSIAQGMAVSWNGLGGHPLIQAGG